MQGTESLPLAEGNKPTTEFIHGDKNKIKPFSSDTPESDVQFPTPFQKLR